MGFYSFYKILKDIIRTLFGKKILKITIIVFLIFTIFFVYNQCFATLSDPSSYIIDAYEETVELEKQNQNSFIYFCLFPYLENTESWNDLIKPIFDDIKENQYDFYVGYNKTSTSITYNIFLYHLSEGTVSTIARQSETYDSYNLKSYIFNNAVRYSLTYNPSDNTHTVQRNSPVTLFIPRSQANIKTDLFIEFNKMIYNPSDITSFFNAVRSYLSSIDEVNNDILTELNTLSSYLSQIAQNTNNNYSQDLSNISGDISSLISSNQEIISQNDEMIAQQQEINDNLSTINEAITDSTVDSSSIELPTDNTNDPTQSGVDNIFQTIYNSFTSGIAQDIIFPIPFTNKNITLQANYLYNVLQNNNASWIITIIQAFWWYLISRFIITDIMRKIRKIKQGNFENIQNSNIKEDML